MSVSGGVNGSEGAREGEAYGLGMVSLIAEVPESLLLAMHAFIDRHPNWDQYRLFQAALAGFLVQHGTQNRDVTRCYLANLFPGQGRFDGSTNPGQRRHSLVSKPTNNPSEVRAA